ncbi:PREDICTED: endosomal/lysomomal potassium channel TMEM175-like isoform X2 [Amphimedon queenslandica]|uniref:Endosomal/lysosomal proton channel TMEM175 n=1 Tax=Amphimedon queenslandica TaxID=400682 RepID=A0AAN0JL00_AMPQE|nr:PREDICTED: endosomal/lysomomal potassium channel TMEM175-like isoform X2 [Amphimedon queenslandica]|eukprot:XP_019857458.1 PREDICTED: endosomal/lysomomal potassium channel TMEM175-like isoform X2 [Amphimedon queenslandica]
MPIHLRHHVFAKERLVAFSDAVFAIIATIMVIPLKIPEFVTDGANFNLEDYIINSDFALQVAIYYLAFYLVWDAWLSHCRVFHILEHVDDFVTFLNLVALLFISLLPASISLVSSYPEDSLALTIAFLNILLISIAMFFLVFFAVRQTQMLDSLIVEAVKVRTLKWTLYAPLLINPLIALLAIIFAWGVTDQPKIGIITLFMIIPFNFLARFILKKIQVRYLRKRVIYLTNEDEGIFCLINNFVSKERTLALSDGVFSIIGTLIVLDLTADIYKKEGKATEATDFLKEEQYAFYSYFSSFMIAGLLWFIHHSMFSLISAVNSYITIFNGLSLMFLGLIPFGAGVASSFIDGTNTNNEITSVRIMVALIILASLSQLALWSVAHCEKSKCLSNEVNSHMIEFIQLWKLLIFPFTGLLVYLVSFSSGVTLNHFYTYFTFAVPVLFILPRAMLFLMTRIKCFTTKASEERPVSAVSDLRYSRIQIQNEPADTTGLIYNQHDNNYLTTDTFKKLPGSTTSVDGGTITEETN